MTQTAAATAHIPADVRERITAAAAELFEQSGRETMPTVDAVRRAARVDMNAASSVMKEWRRAQTAQATPVAVSVPEVVQQASNTAMATMWQQAQQLANESLRNTQAAWETERAELDAMRQELAEAFERQAGELEVAGAALVAESAAVARQVQELTAVRQQLGDASSRADKAEARIDEIELRAAELRAELDRAHTDADRLRIESTEARQHAAAELEAARVDLVKLQAKAEAAAAELAKAHAATTVATAAADTARTELAQAHATATVAAAEVQRTTAAATTAAAERDTARQDAATAREAAAKLEGRFEAMQVQINDLMRALAERHAAAPAQQQETAKPAAKTLATKSKKSEVANQKLD